MVLWLLTSAGACNLMPAISPPALGPAAQNVGGIQGANAGSTSPTTMGAQPPSVAVKTSLLEQLSLERINRARLHPTAEAAAGGIDLNEGVQLSSRLDPTPKQPLAMNAILRRVAVEHSRDMLARNYFDHLTPEGLSPFDRMRDAGFVFIAAGENLAWRGTTGSLDPVNTVESQHDDLFVDVGITNRGHRLVMMDGRFREVGIGILRGSFTRSDGTAFSDSIIQTQDYATAPSLTTFVLGVVYDDLDGNGRYDFGEGVANSTVSLAGTAETTNEAGGYAFQVDQPGTLMLRFASGRTISLTIQPGDPNVKVDLVDANRIVINLGLGLLN